MKEKITKGIKGFNKDLTCKGLQYKEGETFKMEGDPERCKRGFHFCTEPLDLFSYYDPANSVYHYVEGYGKTSKDKEDSKVAVSKIKIGAKLSIAEFVKLSFEAILKRCKDNKIENSGDSSMASNSGYRSSIEVIGEKSLAIGFGIDNKARASLGSWICLAEWIERDDGWQLKTVKTAKIDGEKLLPNTWYILKNGRFIKDK